MDYIETRGQYKIIRILRYVPVGIGMQIVAEQAHLFRVDQHVPEDVVILRFDNNRTSCEFYIPLQAWEFFIKQDPKQIEEALKEVEDRKRMRELEKQIREFESNASVTVKT